MFTDDNQFNQQASGQADWDSGLGGNFTILERGFHTTLQAGMNVRTGDVLTITSSGFWLAYDSRSGAIKPRAISYTAAASGDSLNALLWGIARLWDVNSIPGAGVDFYVNTADPGAIIPMSVATPGKQVGFSVKSGGLVFRPAI